MKLAAENLGFGYAGHPVGSGVAMTLAQGEVVCLLGPNGGGKTTLFKTLLGLLKPLDGRVTLDGIDIARLARADFARAVGYVPQAQTGYFPFTVDDVVLMGRTAHMGPFSAPGMADRKAARMALERLGIVHLGPRVYTQVSGGERQLALIARALAGGPSLLVMDEPTASLDFGNQTRVLAQISALARDGVGILLSTHDPDHAFACATHVALLHGGGLVANGPPDATITSAAMRLLYGVEVEIAEIADARGALHRVCLPAR
jgi:iron complex transport system ATP-binding protein